MSKLGTEALSLFGTGTCAQCEVSLSQQLFVALKVTYQTPNFHFLPKTLNRCLQKMVFTLEDMLSFDKLSIIGLQGYHHLPELLVLHRR
jgi:hypothetical protein